MEPEKTQAEQQFVSAVVPVRNEAQHISRCLESLTAQDYPKEKLEVIAVDGLSEDETPEILSRYKKHFPFIKVISNPKRSTPSGLNLGIKESRGDVIIILSAHSRADPFFVSRSVEILKSTGDFCVGGVMEAVGEGYLGEAIALTLGSPFGVGGARFRYSRRAQHVDTVAYGAYRREVFDLVGLFDERLERNQDIEFNYRLRKSGGRIFLAPEIKSYYYGPQTLALFLRQAFNNGFWNIRTISLTGLSLSYRHLIPLVFVLALLTASILSAFTVAGDYLLILVATAYLVASLAASSLVALRRGAKFLPLLPLLFLGLHLSYGWGSLRALFSLPRRR